MCPLHRLTSTSESLPSEPGTYILVFSVKEEMTFPVGKLGTLVLQPGTYVYVGSAHGPGGLAARVGRHLRPHKRAHWHIDYVTTHISPTEVRYVTGEEALECVWVQELLRRPGT